jgi:hypothetical protein
VRRALVALIGGSYALAWCVQVVKDGSTLADGVLPGWAALRVSLTPIWPGDPGNFGNFGGTRLEACLCVGTGLTNLIFVAAFARLIRREPPRTTMWSWILIAAAALNTFWMTNSGGPPDLRAGYYLWFGSFVALGLAARVGLGRNAAR